MKRRIDQRNTGHNQGHFTLKEPSIALNRFLINAFCKDGRVLF